MLRGGIHIVDGQVAFRRDRVRSLGLGGEGRPPGPSSGVATARHGPTTG